MIRFIATPLDFVALRPDALQCTLNSERDRQGGRSETKTQRDNAGEEAGEKVSE